jgi:HEAT repeat protein
MDKTQTGKRAILISIALGFLASGCFLLVGCGKTKPPMLAGGKSVEHWVQALADHNLKVREEAVTKLGNVGTSDPTAIPALIGALKDKNAHVRCGAILALAKSPQAAQEAIAPITELQQHDHDPKVRDYAAKSLRRLQGGSGAS